MKIIHIFQKRATASLAVLAVAALTFSSCSKSEGVKPDDTTTVVTPTRDADKVPYYKVQRVENLAAQTDDQNPTEPKTEILFSLDYKKEQPATYAKTTLWDISLSGLYNSFLGPNSNTDSGNSGYQGPGKGGITIVQQAFEDVTAIPAAADFKTTKGLIGTDDRGSFGTGTGWYLYDFGGTEVGDGSATKVHVAYALGNALKLADGSTLAARTIIVKTASGDYAKIKMISCYKDIFTPDQMLTNSPHMYFTFEYMIVPAGSTKFEIK
ncbi:HmuY family protein [Mucilaginibacter sp. CAU 1740]|uniref:HmuY family protein n=1 Tax=Mucilaginibacter sp. CAU 1740 TaxID=3140365 RepID=UPI00325AEC1B